MLLAEAPLLPEPVRDGELVHAPLIPAHRICVSPTREGRSYLPSRVYPALVGNIKDLDLYRVVQSRVSHDQLLYLGPGGEQLVVRAEH